MGHALAWDSPARWRSSKWVFALYCPKKALQRESSDSGRQNNSCRGAQRANMLCLWWLTSCFYVARRMLCVMLESVCLDHWCTRWKTCTFWNQLFMHFYWRRLLQNWVCCVFFHYFSFSCFVQNKPITVLQIFQMNTSLTGKPSNIHLYRKSPSEITVDRAEKRCDWLWADPSECDSVGERRSRIKGKEAGDLGVRFHRSALVDVMRWSQKHPNKNIPPPIISVRQEGRKKTFDHKNTAASQCACDGSYVSLTQWKEAPRKRAVKVPHHYRIHD